jgi:hypothetical protein
MCWRSGDGREGRFENAVLVGAVGAAGAARKDGAKDAAEPKAKVVGGEKEKLEEADVGCGEKLKGAGGIVEDADVKLIGLDAPANGGAEPKSGALKVDAAESDRNKGIDIDEEEPEESGFWLFVGANAVERGPKTPVWRPSPAAWLRRASPPSPSPPSAPSRSASSRPSSSQPAATRVDWPIAARMRRGDAGEPVNVNTGNGGDGTEPNENGGGDTCGFAGPEELDMFEGWVFEDMLFDADTFEPNGSWIVQIFLATRTQYCTRREL